MMNNMKAYELNETAMEKVAGGNFIADYNDPNNVIRSEEDFHIWFNLSYDDKQRVLAQPDADSRRELMYALANGATVFPHGGGVSGSW